MCDLAVTKDVGRIYTQILGLPTCVAHHFQDFSPFHPKFVLSTLNFSVALQASKTVVFCHWNCGYWVVTSDQKQTNKKPPKPYNSIFICCAWDLSRQHLLVPICFDHFPVPLNRAFKNTLFRFYSFICRKFCSANSINSPLPEARPLNSCFKGVLGQFSTLLYAQYERIYDHSLMIFDSSTNPRIDL